MAHRATNVVSAFEFKFKVKFIPKKHNFPNPKNRVHSVFLNGIARIIVNVLDYPLSPDRIVFEFLKKQRITILFARVYEVLRHRGRCSLDWDVRQSS